MTATVSDFLGAENSAWTITIAKGAWAKTGSDETSSTTALDSSATLTVGSKALTTDGVKVTEGTEGTKTIDPMDLKLDIANNTLLTTGTYTNTLTWTWLIQPTPTNNRNINNDKTCQNITAPCRIRAGAGIHISDESAGGEPAFFGYASRVAPAA
ncbi:hypothetical protein [Lacticaseibacillus sharpeae]|uniref:hypothetical protein n=1 Tax=Lacticaseibacillus sharpeae TaxID=1626 RepID=UPI00156B8690|nr:hypothetical protein [Lacticaseibacillus sharpeae]